MLTDVERADMNNVNTPEWQRLRLYARDLLATAHAYDVAADAPGLHAAAARYLSTRSARLNAEAGHNLERSNQLKEKILARLDASPPSTEGSVILVETNGADPETTTQLRGNGVAVISIDWDEVERGKNPAYIEGILERIEELDVANVAPPHHVGMPAVIAQLREALDLDPSDKGLTERELDLLT